MEGPQWHAPRNSHSQSYIQFPSQELFPHKIRSKGWVAQKPFVDRCFDGGAKMFQGLGPKRHESWIANWVYGKYGGCAPFALWKNFGSTYP